MDYEEIKKNYEELKKSAAAGDLGIWQYQHYEDEPIKGTAAEIVEHIENEVSTTVEQAKIKVFPDEIRAIILFVSSLTRL